MDDVSLPQIWGRDVVPDATGSGTAFWKTSDPDPIFPLGKIRFVVQSYPYVSKYFHICIPTKPKVESESGFLLDRIRWFCPVTTS